MKFRTVLIVTLVLIVAFAVGVGAEGPRQGGELTILQSASADNVDPQRTTLSASWWVFSMIVDNLTALGHNLEPEPHLAESWKMSEDGLTWTFHLRRGVRFHDGTPLNAEAVAFSLNRFVTTAPLKWMLAPVEEAIAVDEYTVELRLKEPFPLLLYMLSVDYTGIISPAALEKYGDDFGIKGMVGTGPFKLQEFVPGDKVVLVRNEEYTWGPPHVENKGPAHLERIIFRVIPEGMTRIMELERGRNMLTPAIPLVDWVRLKADPNIQVIEVPGRGADYIAFNVTKWPFDDVRIRQAFIHAIDVEPIIAVVLEGLAVRAYGITAPGQIGYWEGLPEFAAPYLEYDPEKARQLFAEAGWVPGPDGILVHEETGRRAEFEWWRSSVPGAELDAAEVKVEQLRGIGIDIELVLMEGGTLRVRRGEGVHDLFQWGYGWSYACGVLNFFYHTDNVGGSNANHLSDPKMDELIEIARTAIDPEVRLEAIAEAQRYAIELALMVPLWHSLAGYAATADVGGLELLVLHPWWTRDIFALDLYGR